MSGLLKGCASDVALRSQEGQFSFCFNKAELSSSKLVFNLPNTGQVSVHFCKPLLRSSAEAIDE